MTDASSPDPEATPDPHPDSPPPDPNRSPDPHPDSVPQEQPPDKVPVETPPPGQGDIDIPADVPSENPGAPGRNHPDARPDPLPS